ncbi:MAG: phospho-N-acetylmuramoyl-pentapeptide-transferase [Lachnospiraceae bacterium]|nr:phospho-N-acetylmuramoyl-pentapeptide-transferase [Lachnospiraceae bacterium]
MFGFIIDKPDLLMTAGVFFAFIFTAVFTKVFMNKLPRDGGRKFAFNGNLSEGKPRGAGIIFVTVFSVCVILFSKLTVENVGYVLMIMLMMFTGFLDDSATNSWGEYKKGLLDFFISLGVAFIYLRNNPPVIELYLVGQTLKIPVIVFAILIVILMWGAVNVTNCSDGVDGLSGSLTIVSLLSFHILACVWKKDADFFGIPLMMCAAILAYLWYNATPSILMMGDAGSRAMGLLIGISALKSGDPFMFIPLALILILDGGLGLIKITLIRFFKIHIMKNTRTPLHDHYRKTKNWSNTQTVFRFVILQILVSFIFIAAYCMEV